MRTLNMLIGGAVAAAAAVTISCGGSSSAASTGPSGACTPSSSPATLVIQNNTICPSALTVTRGTQITILNSDSRVHTMDSDPHPEHTDCPEINQIGFLNPGQSRQSGNLNIARRCGIHDHDLPDVASLKATITIQ
jgi:plastocyanin